MKKRQREDIERLRSVESLSILSLRKSMESAEVSKVPSKSTETVDEKSLRLACEAFFEEDAEPLKSEKCTWILNMVKIAKSIKK